MYWNFFLDFGPLNLGQLARFCQKLNDKLRKFPVVCFYSSATSQAKRANAIFLICAWQLLYLDRSPEQAYHGFDTDRSSSATTRSNSSKNNNNSNNNSNCSQPPVSQSQGALTIAALPPFHDASPCQCTYDLSIMDCLQGLQKARQHGFYNHETFDVEEYEHYEQVEVRIVDDDDDDDGDQCADVANLRLLTWLSLTHTHTLSLFFYFDCTEWRFELDRSRQDSSLCRSFVRTNGITRRLLYVGTVRLHSLLYQEKHWSGGATQSEKLPRTRFYQCRHSTCRCLFYRWFLPSHESATKSLDGL